MTAEFPFSTERSSLLNTETFRNLLGNALEKSQKSVIILSAYVKSVGINWLKDKIKNKNVKCTIVHLVTIVPVSCTHLTLPTSRSVLL